MTILRLLCIIMIKSKYLSLPSVNHNYSQTASNPHHTSFFLFILHLHGKNSSEDIAIFDLTLRKKNTD